MARDTDDDEAGGKEGGRKPDYNVKAYRSGSREKPLKVGAGWNNKNGSISIRLDEFVVFHGGRDQTLLVWPADERSSRSSGSSGSSARRRYIVD